MRCGGFFAADVAHVEAETDVVGDGKVREEGVGLEDEADIAAMRRDIVEAAAA